MDLIWEYRIDRPAEMKILPSGKVELIFRLCPALRMKPAKKIGEDDSPLGQFCFLSGLHTGPLDVSFEQFHCMGVQMRPVAVKGLFGIPLCEIRDYYAEGEGILGPVAEIEERLRSFGSFRDRALWLERFLHRRIRETAELHTAISLLRTSGTYICRKNAGPHRSIEDLLGYSRTHTFRLFNEWFGLSAHSYEQLIRFVHSVHALHHPSGNLAATGLECGYFDQSHFIRSFRAFSGMTPGAYRKQMSRLPGQIFT